MSLTVAYSEYIQQHYPVLSEQPATSERPPLPDYHTATTTAAHRMLPPRQSPQHIRSRSYDVAYFEPDGKRVWQVIMLAFIAGLQLCPVVGQRPQHAVSKLVCLVQSSARSCCSSICPGRLSTAWLVSLVVFSCHGLQVVTREVHRSSFRRLICPAQDHFIVLTLLITSMTFVLSLTQITARCWYFYPCMWCWAYLFPYCIIITNLWSIACCGFPLLGLWM